MDISRSDDRRAIKRSISHRIVGWFAPESPEKKGLPIHRTGALIKLRETCQGLDDLFLIAFRRSLELTNLEVQDNSKGWKVNLIIQPYEHEQFRNFRSEGQNFREDPLVESLAYFQKATTLPYWQKAIDFLAFENDGFTGRTQYGANGLEPYPTAKVMSSGWTSRILEFESLASYLPDLVVEAVTGSPPLPGDVLVGIRKRTVLLDSLLRRTYHKTSSEEPQWIPLGAQIENSWPSNVPKENFAPSGKVVQAYPTRTQTKSPVSPTTTLIISISSVLSGILSVLSYMKAPPTPGTAKDADFFSLLQSSVMQASSIGIMMLSFRNIRLLKQARIYTWVLAVFGLVVSVLAVPMYVLVPTGLSTLLAAAGGIVQGFITLLLVYSVGR